MDYTKIFSNADSDGMIDLESTLKKPEGFDERIQEMKRRIEAISIKLNGFGSGDR
jgi:hypothetical protein